MVQGISPFDEDNLAEWGDRSACDPSTIGCDVSAIGYLSSSYQGALWASTFGSDGSSDCTCTICNPYQYSDMTSYMSEETPLWTRIHCFLAASEASGYDVSPCVAAIVDTGTLPCVDDVYEAPTVDQLECEANGIKESSASSSWEECIWDGDPRTAQEMFPFTSPSSLATVASAVVNTNSCLVGCLVRGISPFDDDGLAVWDNRGTCDSATIGCEVSTINYPSASYQGALWASSWGTDGSSGCTCSICDPYAWSNTTSYMSQETSLWSRIHCYLVASEGSGYDVSPCVAAIVDTGTLPCVDDVYEPPTVDQFECETNGINDPSTSGSWEECIWAGEYRSTDELYSGTQESSPLLGPTAAPAASNTRDVIPEPVITHTKSPDPTPTALSVISPPSTNGPQPGITITASADPTAAPSSATSWLSANGPQPSPTSTTSPYPTPPTPPGNSSPNAGGSTLPLDVEGGVSCSVGSTCQAGYCCHPDTSMCGRSELRPAMRQYVLKCEHGQQGVSSSPACCAMNRSYG